MIKTILLTLLILLVGIFFHLDYKNLDDIKTGKISLVCNLPTGPQIIPPEKVLDRIDGNIYVFTNGYSKSCKTFKNDH